MTITAYPKSGLTTSEEQWAEYFDQVIGTGAAGLDSFEPSADGSGLSVKIDPGFGFVRGTAWKSTAVETQTLDAAPSSGSGLSRIDTVVAERDFAQSTIVRLVTVKGSPAASPVPPTLTQDVPGVYQWPICDVLLGPGATSIGAAQLSDRRTFVGSNVGIWTTATRPAHRFGMFGFNETSSEWEWSDGSAWNSITVKAAQILDASTVGRNVLTASNAGNARSALGATSVGSDVFTAASVKAAREALRFFKGNGPASPQAGDIRFRDL